MVKGGSAMKSQVGTSNYEAHNFHMHATFSTLFGPCKGLNY